jgi:succinate-semialdehyde dehydrogenase/glutarate-semialdehyde dehydrogenase
MSTLTTSTTTTDALIGADPAAVAHADRVIAGLRLPAVGIEVADPATGECIAHIADIDVDGALRAVATAHEAGRSWALTTPRQRADVLRAWYALLVEHTEDLAHLISREMGKPLAEARGEVKYGTDFVRWYAEEAVRPGGNVRGRPTAARPSSPAAPRWDSRCSSRRGTSRWRWRPARSRRLWLPAVRR